MGPGAFLEFATGVSALPSCLELILVVILESMQGNQALSRVGGENCAFKLWQDPWVPLQVQVENGLLLWSDGDVGIPFQTKQGNRHSSPVEEGKTGLFLSSGEKLSIPLE